MFELHIIIEIHFLIFIIQYFNILHRYCCHSSCYIGDHSDNVFYYTGYNNNSTKRFPQEQTVSGTQTILYRLGIGWN